MSSASLSDLQAFQELATRFAKKELEPKAIDLDDYPFGAFNDAALKVAEEVGLFKLMVPEALGGSGQGVAVLCQILEELAGADASFAAVVLVHSMAQAALVQWGTAPVIDKYLRSPLLAFPAYVLPTDLPRTVSAEKRGGGFVLSGKLDYLALAPVAQALIVPAEGKGTDKVGFFVVDSRAKGLSIGEPVLSLGLRNCPVADVELAGVEVGAENQLCAEADAVYPALAAGFRPAVAALSVGVVAGSFETAKNYAKERYQGGRMIVEYDQVRLLLANLAVVAESGKALVRSMAIAADEKRPWPVSDAGLILLSEAASRATSDGVQVLGGYGYMQDYGQEKRMRDAKQIEAIFGAAPVKRLELIADILRQEE